jgi:hypothetical protein
MGPEIRPSDQQISAVARSPQTFKIGLKMIAKI